MILSRFCLSPPLIAAVISAAAAIALVPRGLNAGWLLYAQDDPMLLADRAVDMTFSASAAKREIETALSANDADLAASFLELARDRGIPVDVSLAERVADANSTSANASRGAESFARGLITGEPDDAVGLAGTALGDLFVFGDIRDAVREGVRYARGEQVDELVLGLACVGIAVTAGAYASLGLATPARVGFSVVKAARKAGRISTRLADWVGRSTREVVDMAALRHAFTVASLTEPAVAVRAAREAVKAEKAGDLVGLVSDVGRVQVKAGTQAALDGLKVAEGPRDVARLARIAEAKGGKTRAILKLAGRAAITLTVAAFNLVSWLFAALMAVFGFCSAVKNATERCTRWVIRVNRARRERQRHSVLRRGAAKSASLTMIADRGFAMVGTANSPH